MGWSEGQIQYCNDKEIKGRLNLKEIPRHYQTDTIYKYRQDKQNFSKSREISNLTQNDKIWSDLGIFMLWKQRRK